MEIVAATLSDGGTIAGIAGGGIALFALVVSVVSAKTGHAGLAEAKRAANAAEKSAVAASAQVQAAFLTLQRDEDRAAIEAMVSFPRLRITGGNFGTPHTKLWISYQAGKVPANDIQVLVIHQGMRAHGRVDLLAEHGSPIECAAVPIAGAPTASATESLLARPLRRDEHYVELRWRSTAGGTGRWAGRYHLGELREVVADDVTPG